FFKGFPSGELGEWKSFSDWVGARLDFIRGLTNKEGSIGRCSIILPPVSEGFEPGNQWRNTWREIQLITDAGAGEILRGSQNDQGLGEVSASNKFGLRFIKNAADSNSAPRNFSTPLWGPLWLIYKYNGTQVKGDKTSWIVEIP